jgi:hypothetical protein
MLQMKMVRGENEEIMDLVDTPEFVLVQFCDMVLKHQDMRNPEAQRLVRENIVALKIKAEKDSTDLVSFDRHNLKRYISGIEELLEQFS